MLYIAKASVSHPISRLQKVSRKDHLPLDRQIADRSTEREREIEKESKFAAHSAYTLHTVLCPIEWHRITSTFSILCQGLLFEKRKTNERPFDKIFQLGQS